jgi:hypothetical protein
MLIVLLLVVLPIFIILGMILGYVTLFGVCLVGVFLPRRPRKEWFAKLRGGFPSLEEIERRVRERQSNGVVQAPEE